MLVMRQCHHAWKLAEQLSAGELCAAPSSTRLPYSLYRTHVIKCIYIIPNRKKLMSWKNHLGTIYIRYSLILRSKKHEIRWQCSYIRAIHINVFTKKISAPILSASNDFYLIGIPWGKCTAEIRANYISIQVHYWTIKDKKNSAQPLWLRTIIITDEFCSIERRGVSWVYLTFFEFTWPPRKRL